MAETHVNRVRIEQSSESVLYSVSAWPGVRDVIHTSGPYLITGATFAIVSYLFQVLTVSLSDISPYGYINRGIGTVLTNAAGLAGVLCIVTICVILPAILAMHIRHRNFWIENRYLCFQSKFLSAYKMNRKIPFDRIIEIRIGKSGTKKTRYNLVIIYEHKLPKPVSALITLFTRKRNQPLLLASGMRSFEEAEGIQLQLLSALSKPERSDQSETYLV